VTGSSLFHHTPKSINDMKTMLKVYQALKEKFVTQDVIEANEEGNEIQRFFCEQFSDKEYNENWLAKNAILDILQNTNSYNGPITLALLDDDNFNNLDIPSALRGLKDKERSEYGARVLKIAQDTGYDKEFSCALAILISEATKENMPVIEKIISTDQEFLSENLDFVSGGLMSFLRFRTNAPIIYLSIDDMTLHDIVELIDMQNNEDNFDNKK